MSKTSQHKVTEAMAARAVVVLFQAGFAIWEVSVLLEMDEKIINDILRRAMR